MKYYVYILIDPRNEQPFYVGKGYKNRMMSHESEVRRGQFTNKEKCETIQSIWDGGLHVKYEQIFVENDAQSRVKERELIFKYGRRCNGGLLTNKHIGGNGGGKVGKQVCQYDVKGNLIFEYKSASEAERLTGVRLSKITAVCRGDWNIAGGFQWKWKGELPILNYVRKSEKMRRIKSYTMDGTLVSEYNSQYEAALQCFGNSKFFTKISACCLYKIPSYKGFQWRFYEDTPPGKIHPQRKGVVQCGIDGTVVAVYNSIAQAVKETGITTVGAACNNPTKHEQSGGFIWRFEN